MSCSPLAQAEVEITKTVSQASTGWLDLAIAVGPPLMTLGAMVIAFRALTSWRRQFNYDLVHRLLTDLLNLGWRVRYLGEPIDAASKEEVGIFNDRWRETLNAVSGRSITIDEGARRGRAVIGFDEHDEDGGRPPLLAPGLGPGRSGHNRRRCWRCREW